MKYILRELLQNKAGPIPNGPKQGFGASIRRGSELENFLVKNVEQNLKLLSEILRETRLLEWINTFQQSTKKWNQNSLFSLSIWSDWIIRIRKEFPRIKAY